MKFKTLNFNSPETTGEEIITMAIKKRYPLNVIDDLVQKFYAICDISDEQFNEINQFIFMMNNRI